MLTAGETELMSESTKRSHVILLIHGIRTRADWVTRVARILEEDPSIRVKPVKYGYFDTLRFLWPSDFTRRRPLKRVEDLVRYERQSNPSARISILAHSFGTYIGLLAVFSG